MAQVKGTTLYGRTKYVKRYHGEQVLERVLTQLKDQHLASELRRGALRSAWYPFELFVDFIECVDRVCGSGDGRLYRPMAGQVAQDDLSTIYKAFFRVASPAFILGKAGQVWRQYYDSGELVVLKDEPGHVQLEVRDFATPHRVHCESIAGWIERCVEMTGKREASVRHPSCRALGGERCLFDASWKA